MRQLALVVALVVSLASAGATSGADELACNGHAELCDRPVTAVTFAATHNAMASSAAGYRVPEQGPTMLGQLDAGVRALLIDAWFAAPAGPVTLTDLSASKTSERDLARLLGTRAASIAIAIRKATPRLLVGKRDVYLCHGFCEIGSTRLSRFARDLKRWLDAHPSDVVALVIEDHTTPKDIAAVLTAAALVDRIYTHPATAPWPTLRELVAARRQLLVLTQGRADGVPWLLRTADVVEETPYRFTSAAALSGATSCAIGRGGAGRPFFLLNHWISRSPPVRADADRVNVEPVLGERARRCAAVRGRNPSFVAVDFAERGALLRVVDALNGL